MQNKVFQLQTKKILQLGLCALTTLSLACTNNSNGPGDPTVVISSNGPGRIYTIQKTQGINIGESNAIWGVGLLTDPASPADPSFLIANVERISLAAGANYSKMTWRIPMTGNLIQSGTGTRTFLSEWGFLFCRGSNATGDVGLYAVDSNLNTWTQVYETGGAAQGARCSAFGYHSQGSDGRDYEFIAFAYPLAGSTGSSQMIQIERFLVNPNSADLASRFTRVTPLIASTSQLVSPAAVYNGFLYPNCGTTGCFPKFYGAIENQIQGFDMTVNVPPTPLPSGGTVTPITTNTFNPPNYNFTSTSHPKAGGPFGSINNGTYSMAGDPYDGYIYWSADPNQSSNWSFMSYDSTNQIVYRSDAKSLNASVPTGSTVPTPTPSGSVTPAPMLSAFRRGCFYDPTLTNCDPRTTKNSVVLNDVGNYIGPSSDLGNGCIAIIGLMRPSGADSNAFNSPVYTACVRDPTDLTKGVSVTQISTILGATYMYNDFTGSTLINLPVSFLFDFTSLHVASFSGANFYWVSSDNQQTMNGINVSYRCYPKGMLPLPAFAPFPGTFPTEHTIASLPNCGSIPGSNQVEFQMQRLPGQKFTRFDLFSVSATQQQ